MAQPRYGDFAVVDEDGQIGSGNTMSRRSNETPMLLKTRSLSDGGGAQLSPSPLIIEAARRTSKDDSALGTTTDRTQQDITTPVTPRRPDLPVRSGLLLQMPHRDTTPPIQPSSYVKPTPLSPKLDHSQIYASPTNILPRRSRGLDFSRAATSLHHSILAEQSSPDSSPTIDGRAMNIPARRSGEYGIEQSSTSLWSMMGNQERMNISSSVGSTNHLISESSSSSDDDTFMDEDMEDAILSTPQGTKGSHSQVSQGAGVVPWLPGTSPALNSLSSFRARPRKQPRKRARGLLGLGFSIATPPALSKSPPNNIAKEMRDLPKPHSRRESISWAANQLHISGSEERNMDTSDSLSTTPSRDGTRGVVKRVVTRRGNLLPKTKGFARIRAALAEESAPVDSEVRREAEVVRQVRESDVDLEPRVAPAPPPPLDISNIPTAQSSPNLVASQDPLDEITEDDMMADSGLSSSFKQQALKNARGKSFWETFSETSSVTGAITTPPPPAFMPRGSSSGISEDVMMDSPSISAGSDNTSLFGQGTPVPIGTQGSDGQKSDMMQQITSISQSQASNSIPPTAAEITRRINNKRRRDDDFDPHSFKRRAVSPGMSVHNSPIMQSPLQMAPWGSRPGSNHGGDKASGTPSENGSQAGANGATTSAGRPIIGGKGRVGFQGMVDTHDGLMRMSIE